MQSFEEYAKYILTNTDHNQVNKRKQVHIIVDYPLLDWGDFKQYLMTLTWQTGIGWSRGSSKSHNVIFAKKLTEGVEQADNYDYALVSYVGTFYRYPQSANDRHIYHYLDEFCKQDDIPAKGHILWHPEKQYGSLHLQSMFLNLKHWRSIGRPSMDKFTGEATVPDICSDNIHDDYTPLWLKPGTLKKEVKGAVQAEWISRVTEDGKTIDNFTALERSTKFFTYPQRAEVSPQLLIEQQKTSNIIYRRNNQKLSNVISDVPNKKYDVIYSPAAGCVGEFLWQKYGHKETKLVLLDNHAPSIKWKDSIYNLYGKLSSLKDIDNITKMVAKNYNCHIDDASYKPQLVEENNNIYSDDEWFNTINNISSVECKVFDFIKDTLEVDSRKLNLIYTSNIFSYMFNYHLYKINDIDSKWQQLLSLPNTTVVGQNVFRKDIVNENYSS